MPRGRRPRDMEERVSLLMPGIDAFFADRRNFDKLVVHIKDTQPGPVADTSGPISCRLLSFMCTAWLAMKSEQRKPVLYKYRGRVVNLGEEYKIARERLPGSFDCYRRGPKITYTAHGTSLETTVGQLCYFKWVIESGALKYAYQVRTEMNAARAALQQSTAQKRKATPGPGPVAKRRKGAVKRRRRRTGIHMFAYTESNVALSLDFGVGEVSVSMPLTQE